MQNCIEIQNTGFKFTLADPASLLIVGSVPHRLFLTALDAVNVLAAERAAVQVNDNLSATGKQNCLAPICTTAWFALCASYADLARYVQATDQREAALLAVPMLESSNSAVAVEDAECRGWFRNLSDKERAKVMTAMSTDEAAGAKYSRVQIALLRSPIPLPDADIDFMQRLWNQGQRCKNVGEALAIDTERNAAEWAASGLAHLMGVAKQLTEWSTANLINFIVKDERRMAAAQGMGFTAYEVADALSRLEPTHQTRRMAA